MPNATLHAKWTIEDEGSCEGCPELGEIVDFFTPFLGAGRASAGIKGYPCKRFVRPSGLTYARPEKCKKELSDD